MSCSIKSNSKGQLFVISGPSGVGKGTIVNKLVKILPDLEHSISATTRKPRKGEIDRKDYYFISEKEFDNKIKRGEFLEWAEVYSQKYGTQKKEVDKSLKNQKNVILDIDVRGALQIKKKIRSATLIFVAPPSLEALSQRLKLRGTDDTKAISDRLKDAEEELSFVNKYDYVVTNDKLDKAVREVKNIIKSHLK